MKNIFVLSAIPLVNGKIVSSFDNWNVCGISTEKTIVAESSLSVIFLTYTGKKEHVFCVSLLSKNITELLPHLFLKARGNIYPPSTKIKRKKKHRALIVGAFLSPFITHIGKLALRRL
eukprot:GEMP01142003.1.p2 GENE.GEMP01142003.1~~GEMP01142003.1.p2  ORF type:complete len:118 (-),score=4.10 GEMP01142003.1:10-363(-)